MEAIKRKKKDKKPLYILIFFLVFFGGFIYAITRPSTQAKAIKELEVSYNKKDVEMVWYKYKADLYQDENFLFETRKKLSSFKLTENDVKECKSWLPPPPTSINTIVIPDLSRRIIDTVNNPNQISNDIFVLNIIWESFVELTKLKEDSKDKLVVDVTDIDQARGQFGQLANGLQFDLATHAGKSNRLYFTEEKAELFYKNIIALYESAKGRPLGADYRFYLRRYLLTHLKKPTLFDNYVNKIVIITDGYLEAENKPADTKINGFQDKFYPAVAAGNVLQVITANRLNIPVGDIDLHDAQILVCEVNERKTGKGYDFEILKAYWEDWFQRMGAKVTVIQRQQANNMTASSIKAFMNQ